MQAHKGLGGLVRYPPTNDGPRRSSSFGSAFVLASKPISIQNQATAAVSIRTGGPGGRRAVTATRISRADLARQVLSCAHANCVAISGARDVDEVSLFDAELQQQGHDSLAIPIAASA
jgi:hypothetical protein